jgi:hypothetical protein
VCCCDLATFAREMGALVANAGGTATPAGVWA